MPTSPLLCFIMLMLGCFSSWAVAADYKKYAQDVAVSVSAITAEQLPVLTEKAKAGDRHSQLLLGFAYFFGQGVARDLQQAMEWLSRAAQQGDVLAQYQLGVNYADEAHAFRDPSQAVHWYTQAAEQGFIEAQFRLGTHYRTGIGVAQSDSEAFEWFRMAADQGHAEAQWSLGVLYQTGGAGVSKNPPDAIKYYSLAAQQGFARAPYFLGKMYELGQGIESDKIAAYKWYSIAEALGERVALRFKESTAKTMTPQEIEEAQQSASEWLKQHPVQPGR